ncbi:hypothetical protein [Gloeocapsopsis sp. IPPAS B-1203]|uniref:hypothetical protein n=1 Tax=Gloeocapsopsis sp. IPPAS B-1203 TaxID=2049454 RepID=UPI00117E47F7|nr:hypothetical protein [Gloeocapsopsis sp. IPPAS B-1203]
MPAILNDCQRGRSHEEEQSLATDWEMTEAIAFGKTRNVHTVSLQENRKCVIVALIVRCWFLPFKLF